MSAGLVHADAAGDEDEPAHEGVEFLRNTSNIERMEAAAAAYTRKALTMMSAHDPNAIDRELLKHVIKVQRDRFYGCLTLPFSVAFFFFFAFSSLLHEDITNVYVVQKGLNTQLLNNLVTSTNSPSDSPESIAQIWDWLNTTLMPTVFMQTDIQGKPFKEKSDWSRVLQYSKVHGPVIFEQHRSEQSYCTNYPGFWNDLKCFPSVTKSTSDFGSKVNATALIAEPQPGEYRGGNVTFDARLKYYDSPFSVGDAGSSRKLRSFPHSQVDKAFEKVNAVAGPDVFAASFSPNTPYRLIQEQMNYLRAKAWLDSRSKQLKIKVLLLNAEWGRARLQQYLLYFGFSRQGGAFVLWQLETLFLEMFSGGLSIIVDILWVLTLAVSVVIEIRTLRKARKEGVMRSTLKKPWTILQWLIIFGGLLIIALYVIQNIVRNDVANKLLRVVDDQLKDNPPENLTGETATGSLLHDQADWMTYMTQWQRIIIGQYHLLLMIRFFFAFANQPRLAVVTSTLEVALIDLIHFLIVLLPTFIGYAISGMFIFGRRMDRFSNPGAAIGSCFRILMECQYDWAELTERDWWTAAAWVWSFTILLMLLMVNMILAIVLDVYTEMRKRSGQSEAVWVTLRNMSLQMWYRKIWVSNKNLREGVESMPQQVTREDLLKTFPTMCEAQLGMLMTACRYQNEIQSTHARLAMSESMKMATAAKLVVDKVTEAVHELHQGKVSGYTSVDESEDWIREIAKDLAVQNHLMLSVQWQLQQLEWQWKAIEGIHGKGVAFDTAGKLPDQEEGTVL